MGAAESLPSPAVAGADWFALLCFLPLANQIRRRERVGQTGQKAMLNGRLAPYGRLSVLCVPRATSARMSWISRRWVGSSEVQAEPKPELAVDVREDQFAISPSLEKEMVDWDVCQSPTLSTIQQQAVEKGKVEGSATTAQTASPARPANANTRQEMIPLEEMEYRSNAYREARTFFSYTNYEHIHVKRKEPKLIYCSEATHADAVAMILSRSKVLGFDMEWRPFGPANTALIQLCNQSTIALIHVSKIKDVPQSITELLKSHEVIKVGVAIRGDAMRLLRTHGVNMAGLLDLGAAAHHIDASTFPGKKGIALTKLAKAYLGKELFKGDSMRMSNWGAELSTPQQVYAANDAYSGLQIFYALNQLHEGSEAFEVSHVDPTPAGQGARNARVAAPRPKKTKAAPTRKLETVEDMEKEEPGDDEMSLKVKQAMSLVKRKVLAPKVNEAEAVKQATTWANTLVQAHAKVNASSLRSYALWVQGYEVGEIASLVRDPPLAKSTVENHIFKAVSLEKLPPTNRLKELINGSPYNKRYAYLIRQPTAQSEI